MKRKSNRGGQRPGAGRKPQADPKEYITFGIRQSIIDLFGGKDSYLKFVMLATAKELKELKKNLDN